MICNPNLPSSEQTINRFFRTDCFTAPPDRFGNAGRSTVIGPGINNWDMAVFKNFAITEAVRLQFRSEFFNMLNKTNFRPPVIDWSNAAFGNFTQTYQPRQIRGGVLAVAVEGQ